MRSATIGPRTHNTSHPLLRSHSNLDHDGTQGHGIGGRLPLWLYHHFFFVLTRLAQVFSIALIGEFKLREWVRHGEEIKERTKDGKKRMMRSPVNQS